MDGERREIWVPLPDEDGADTDLSAATMEENACVRNASLSNFKSAKRRFVHHKQVSRNPHSPALTVPVKYTILMRNLWGRLKRKFTAVPAAVPVVPQS